MTLFALACAVANVPGVSWGTLDDVPSLMFVTFGVLGILMIGADSRHWKSAAVCILFASGRDNEDTRRCAYHFFRLAARAAIGSGAIAFLLSIIIMAGNINDLPSLGSGVAVALTAPLYGLVFSEAVFHPLSAALASNDEDESQRT